MRRRDERGSVAVLAGALSFALLAAAALVVDLGVQRVARSDMQSLADVVALDLSRELDGRSKGVLDTIIQSRADASLARNTSSIGGAATVTPVLGTLDPITYEFTALTSSAAVPDAVEVSATTETTFAFGLGTTGTATRSAVGTAQPGACMKLGSSAIDLNSGNSAILSPILNDALNVSVLNPNGLAGLDVQLADLALALGAGTTDELLATQVSAGEFFAAVVEAVGNDDDEDNDDAVNVLTATLIGQIGAQAGLEEFTVGELLAIGPGDNAALQSTVAIFDLVKASAFLANGDNALGLGFASLPLGVSGSLTVLQAPQIACGQGIAKTAQLRLTISQGVDVVVPLLGTVARTTVTMTLELAQATGKVASVTCVDGAPTIVNATLLKSTLADLDALVDVKLVGLPVTSAFIPTTAPTTGGVGTYPLELPLRYETPYPTPAGTGTLGAPDVTRAQLSALGINLGALPAVGNAVVVAINNTANSLEAVLNSTLVPLLGLRVANADLYAVRTPQCLNPILAG